MTETGRKPNLSPRVKRYVLLLAAAWTLCAAPGFVGEARTQEAPLVIGVGLDYPPYSFLDENGKAAGYNVELTEAIAKAVELDVEVRIGPWGDIRTALETGEIDAISGMLYSVERDKLVDFSPPFTIIHHAIFVRRDAPAIETEEDLRGKEIIVMRGDIMHDYVLEKGLCDNPVLVDTQADALRLLASGEHDCALVAKLPGLYWTKELRLSNIVTVGPLLRPSDYSYAVTEGNAALLARLAEGLAVVGETGRHKEIYDKWLGVLEPGGVSPATVIMYVALAAAPLLLLLAASAVWSRLLKRQVARRTAELKEETTERKWADEALRDSKEQLRETRDFLGKLVNHASAPIIVWDPTYRITRFNHAFERLTGFLAEEIIGERLETLFPESSRDESLLKIGETLRGESWDSVEIPVRCKDGETRLALWNSANIYSEDGATLSATIAQGIDITERKRAEEALAEKERYFRTLLYSIHDDILVVDRDYVITDVNNSVLATTGLSREEIVGRHCYKVSHGDNEPCDKHGESCVLYKVFETGEPSSSVHQHLSADGSIVWVDVLMSPLRDRDGNVTHVIESARDITDTTFAQNALCESEEKYRELFTTVPDAIMIFDSETRRFVEVNQSTLDLYGYTREEFLQLTQTEITAEPEASDASIRETLRVKQQHIPIRYHKKRDGTVFPVEISTNAFNLAGRQVVCGTVRDITERLRAEVEMAALARFTSEDPNPVMRLGRDGNVIYVNAAGDPLLEALECERGQVVPHDWQKLVNEVLDSGSVENTELMVLDRTFDLTFTPVVEAGYVNVYGLDISERIRAEKELNRSEIRYRSVVAAAGSVIIGLDPECRVFEWNAAAEHLYGYSRDEALGENYLQRFIPKEVQGEVIRDIEKLLSGEPTENYESPVFTRDGDKRILLWNITSLKGEDGGSIGVIAIGQDITERKRAEEEKRQLEAQFLQAQKMESIGRLAGGIAHDFNNLLTGLMGYTQLLQQRLEDNPALHHDVGRISSLVDRAARLTRQLLAFSRRQTLDPVPLDLNDLVTNSLKMLRRIIGEDIEIKFEPAADIETVRADLGQIDQVLMNLAVNARDAMPSGGTILIHTANVNIDEHYLQEHVGAKPGSYVMLSVTDTGCGMNAETKDRVFEPFFTTKGAGQGTGLGLAVVYGIVKQHGGNIWVYSEPGKGTTFKVYLPRLEKPVELETKKSVREIVPTGTETVLLVEDELILQDVETRMLQDIGYTVLVSSTVQEAETLFAEYGDKVDILVSDVVLPDGYGPQLYKRLAEHKPGLKVLFASGYSYEVMKSRGIKDADEPFLEKPFTLAALAQKIRAVLSTEQMRAEDEQSAPQQTSVA